MLLGTLETVTSVPDGHVAATEPPGQIKVWRSVQDPPLKSTDIYKTVVGEFVGSNSALGTKRLFF
jgi:hypothetical protein